MGREKDLSILLESLNPVLNDGIYVFCCDSNSSDIKREDIFIEIKEQEGNTLVVLKENAISYGLPYEFESSWITLKVQSSLEAIGLTASFSQALGKEGIPCNVIAGFHHDHIFVPISLTQKAMETLNELSKKVQ